MNLIQIEFTSKSICVMILDTQFLTGSALFLYHHVAYNSVSYNYNSALAYELRLSHQVGVRPYRMGHL